MNATKPLVLAALVWAAASPGWSATVEIVIHKYSFQPQEIHIKTGDTLRWVNKEKRQFHSVLFPGAPESEYLFPGDVYEKTFATPGSFPYHCGPHPEMTGTVHVE